MPTRRRSGSMCKLTSISSSLFCFPGFASIWSVIFFPSTITVIPNIANFVTNVIIMIIVHHCFTSNGDITTPNVVLCLSTTTPNDHQNSDATVLTSLYSLNSSLSNSSSLSLTTTSRLVSQIDSNFVVPKDDPKQSESELSINNINRRSRRQNDIPPFIQKCNTDAIKVYQNKIGKKDTLDCCVGLAACKCIDVTCQQDEHKDDPACAKACTTGTKCAAVTLDQCKKLKSVPPNLAMILIIVAVLIVIIVLCVTLLVCYKKLRPKKEEKKKKVSFEIGASPNVKSKIGKKGCPHKSKSKRNTTSAKKGSSMKLSTSKKSGGGSASAGVSGSSNRASSSRGASVSASKDRSTSRGASTSATKDPSISHRTSAGSSNNTSTSRKACNHSNTVHTIYTKTPRPNNDKTTTDKSTDKNSFVSRTSRVVTPSKLSTTQGGFLPTSQQTGSTSQKVSRSVLARAVQ